MVYFSNSGEGLEFERKWCERCVHYEPAKPEVEGETCPVLVAHTCYNGEDGAQAVLDLLIVRRPGTREPRCMLFIEAPGGVPWEG